MNVYSSVMRERGESSCPFVRRERYHGKLAPSGQSTIMASYLPPASPPAADTDQTLGGPCNRMCRVHKGQHAASSLLPIS